MKPTTLPAAVRRSVPWLVAAVALLLMVRTTWAQSTNCSTFVPFCFAGDSPARADDVNQNFKKVADFTVPPGGIIMWTGTVVPTGWALCDGRTQGGVTTPDLRNRFVVGYGSAAAQGSTGGAQTVALGTGNLPAHTHSITNSGAHAHSVVYDTGGGGPYSRPRMFTASGSCNGCAGNDYTDSDAAGDHNHGGATGSVGNGTAFDVRPPYYAIAFIMKTN